MLLTIAGVISAVAIMNAVYPAVTRSTGAVTSASDSVDARIKTDASIIHAVGELAADDTWDDTNGNGLFDFFVWNKNVGNSTIELIDESDLFLGKAGEIQRVPHEDDTGNYPRWSYAIENGSEWDVSVTIKITVSFDDECPSCMKDKGTYFIKLITANGVSTEKYFSM